jgi:uracil-DNA glycosylase
MKKTSPDLEERLKFFIDIGADFVIKSDDRNPSPSGSAAPGERSFCPGEVPPPARDIGAIHAEILTCPKCRLSACRTHAVPGEGDLRAALMFVGEGPGRDEDIQGRPFVGRAGQLLTKIIAAMTFERSEVFITNIVKCRPPENRTPYGDEAEACTPYLVEQIANIRPRVIVTLGKVATDYFVPDATGGMTSIRGQFYDWRGIPVMPTFHPAYLLRQYTPENRKMVWGDLQKVMELLGIRKK